MLRIILKYKKTLDLVSKVFCLCDGVFVSFLTTLMDDKDCDHYFNFIQIRINSIESGFSPIKYETIPLALAKTIHSLFSIKKESFTALSKLKLILFRNKIKLYTRFIKCKLIFFCNCQRKFSLIRSLCV